MLSSIKKSTEQLLLCPVDKCYSIETSFINVVSVTIMTVHWKELKIWWNVTQWGYQKRELQDSSDSASAADFPIILSFTGTHSLKPNSRSRFVLSSFAFRWFILHEFLFNWWAKGKNIPSASRAVNEVKICVTICRTINRTLSVVN